MADDPTHRSLHDSRPEEIQLRDADEEGMMEIRLPIASSGEVRNDGDEPLSSGELRGMATQINENTVGVFPEHGMSDKIDYAGYSQFEKLGYWSDADVESEASDDGEDMLMATARMPDPEPLSHVTGTYREALAILKEQAKRGIPITSSISWREDDDSPGGNDLLEVSIVGIGADPRAATEGGEALVARAAVEAGADPEALVRNVREAVESRPLGPPEDPDRFDSFDECVDALADDPDTSREDAEEICGSWESTSDADDPEETHDMSDEDTPPDEGEQTEQEQDADDGEETETRESGDVDATDFNEMVASHYDGWDTADIDDMLDSSDYIGELNVPEVASLLAERYDVGQDDMMERIESGGEQEMDDDEDEEEDEDEDEEQSTEPEDEQSDDGEDLEERIAELESDLEAVRNGDVEIETPDPEPEDEQSAEDADEETEDEQRDTDDDSTLREEWLST